MEYYGVFKRSTTNICMDMHEPQKHYKEKMIEWIKPDKLYILYNYTSMKS